MLRFGPKASPQYIGNLRKKKKSKFIEDHPQIDPKRYQIRKNTSLENINAEILTQSISTIYGKSLGKWNSVRGQRKRVAAASLMHFRRPVALRAALGRFPYTLH